MIELLRLFGKEINVKDYNKDPNPFIDFAEMNKAALRRGYFVTEKACRRDAWDFITEISINPNATFYKEWNEIISKNRFELLVDQLKHYASTYGTDFQGTPYIPNEGDIKLPDMKNIKIIDTITKDEAIKLLSDMLYSSMAMKQETIEDVWSAAKKLDMDIHIDEIKNKELKLMICDEREIVPENMDEFMRLIVYKATGSTLLIKSKEVLDKIKNEGKINLASYITKDNINHAASAFYRYKPIFMALKKIPEYQTVNSSIVNKIRKLAPKYNKPIHSSFWSECFTKSLLDILEKVKDLNTFKLISLIEECNVRRIGPVYKPYIIRNGKAFIKEQKQYDADDERNRQEYLSFVHEILYHELIQRISKKKCPVILPEFVNLTLPHSEKSFIGNYPLYTSVNIDKDTIVGIYWKNEWGAHDLDLSFINMQGNKIGWNEDYYDTEQNIVFSGDMTEADPDAAELLLFKKKFDDDGIIHVNNYCGEMNARYNLFVAKEKVKHSEWKMNYMCNPDNIILSADDKMDSKEKSIALITGGKLFLAKVRTGNKIVSGESNVTASYVSYMKQTSGCRLSLEKVLKDAGFELAAKDSEAELDFSNPSKEKFMKLLS